MHWIFGVFGWNIILYGVWVEGQKNLLFKTVNIILKGALVTDIVNVDGFEINRRSQIIFYKTETVRSTDILKWYGKEVGRQKKELDQDDWMTTR